MTEGTLLQPTYVLQGQFQKERSYFKAITRIISQSCFYGFIIYILVKIWKDVMLIRAQREDELAVLPRPTASETAGARAMSPAVRFQTSLVCKLGPVSDSVNSALNAFRTYYRKQLFLQTLARILLICFRGFGSFKSWKQLENIIYVIIWFTLKRGLDFRAQVKNPLETCKTGRKLIDMIESSCKMCGKGVKILLYCNICCGSTFTFYPMYLVRCMPHKILILTVYHSLYSCSDGKWMLSRISFFWEAANKCLKLLIYLLIYSFKCLMVGDLCSML